MRIARVGVLGTALVFALVAHSLVPGTTDEGPREPGPAPSPATSPWQARGGVPGRSPDIPGEETNRLQEGGNGASVDAHSSGYCRTSDRPTNELGDRETERRFGSCRSQPRSECGASDQQGSPWAHGGPRRVVIIGSGPTALGAARRLAELRGQFETKVTILEKEAVPGGLASSERDDNGFLWDMGGHVVFSHYEYFDVTLDRAVPQWNQRVRAAFAFMMGSDGKRRFVPYPVQNNIEAMDKADRKRSLEGLEEITRNPPAGKPVDFDQWLLQNFGVGLCEVFMRRYNRKVWTVNTTEMNSVWVGERVAVPDVNKLRAKIQAFDRGTPVEDSGWGPNRYFRFPRFNGTGNIWSGVAGLVPPEWFRFRSRVTSVNFDSKTVTVEGAGGVPRTVPYDALISTAPLDELVRSLNGDDPSLAQIDQCVSQLIYSHTHVVGIGLLGQPPTILADKSWMYFPDSDSPFYRVTVFSAYSDNHVPKAGAYWSLMCEAAEPQRAPDPSYWTKSNVVEATVRALVTYGFISADMVVSKYHRRLDHGYPVPSLGREKALHIVQPWLEAKHIYSRGRFGGWRYEVANQDHSFMQGVEVVDTVLRGVDEETYSNPNLVNSRKNTGRFLEPDLENEFILLRD